MPTKLDLLVDDDDDDDDSYLTLVIMEDAACGAELTGFDWTGT